MTGHPLQGSRVLVTGATGFIGGRVVERLVRECGADVRALVSGYANASRIARFPVEMVVGDLRDAEAVSRAVDGCDIVVHCAYGSRGSAAERRSVTVDGTRHALEAALGAGVRRFVHMSTMVVYGAAIDGPLDETAPMRPSGAVYSDTKIEAEELVFAYGARGLPVTVLQPTAVYGPYAPTWTVDVLETLAHHRQILVDGGTGSSNPVYIDDVVSAILLAAHAPGAVGEAFLVSSGERVDWATFFGRYEAMLGEPGTVVLSRADAEAVWMQSQRRPLLTTELLRIVRDRPEVRARISRSVPVAWLLRHARPWLGPLKRALGIGSSRRSGGAPPPRDVRADETARKPIQPIRPSQVAFFAADTDVRIEKARTRLGYRPHFDLDAGMERTEAWARWANLLDPRSDVRRES